MHTFDCSLHLPLLALVKSKHRLMAIAMKADIDVNLSDSAGIEGERRCERRWSR
jgi:hypothetical protein